MFERQTGESDGMHPFTFSSGMELLSSPLDGLRIDVPTG